MLGVVGRALDGSVQSLATVSSVSVGPAEQQRSGAGDELRDGARVRTSELHSPLQVVVLQPHVGELGIAFSHDGVPQLSGLLHVLTVKTLIGSTHTGQHQRHTVCSQHEESSLGK